MKNLSNAASSMTAIVNTFNKNDQYKNFSDMHHASGIIGTGATKKNTKGSQTSTMDESNSDEDNKGKDKDEGKHYEDDNFTNLVKPKRDQSSMLTLTILMTATALTIMIGQASMSNKSN